MTLHIRAAEPADVPALLDLVHSAYRGDSARGGWTHEADLLVHVRNMAHPDREAQRDDVDDVLTSLGLGEEDAPPRIEAWNKVDLVSAEERERLYEEAARREDVVPISAVTGEGLDALRARMAECLRSGEQVHRIRLPATEGSKIAWLHSRGEVLDQTIDHDELELSVRLSPDNWARFQALESA